MERSCGDAAKKKDGDCLQQSWRVFVQNRRIGVPSYVTGVGSACKRGWSPWDGAKKKRASQKLDSQFIISQRPDSPASSSCVWCSGAHTRPVVADAYVGTLVSGPVARRTRS